MPFPFGPRLTLGGVFDPGKGTVGLPLAFGFPPGVNGVGLGPPLLRKLKKNEI